MDAGTTLAEGGGPRPKRQRLADGRSAALVAAVSATASAAVLGAGDAEGEEDVDPAVMPHLAGGKWSLSEKNYLNQRGAKVRGQGGQRGRRILTL